MNPSRFSPLALVRAIRFPGGILAFAAFSLLLAGSVPAVDLVSQSTLTNVAGAGNSFVAGVSGDGSVVLFLSEARDLVLNDDSAPYLDLFARDIPSGVTTLLSVNAIGLGGGNGNSLAPSISSDGRWVVFQTAASNLV